MKRCFFLPIIFALSILRAVDSTDVHPPGSLGLALHEVTAEEVQAFTLPGEYGAWVVGVAPQGPSAAAGVQVNDVIVSYNGERVEGMRSLQRLVQESPAGRNVELRLIRGGKAVLTQVVLGAGQISTAAGQPAPAPRSLGAWVEALNPQLASFLGLEEGVGFLVKEVQEGSAAHRSGLQAKDVLESIGGQPVNSAESIATVLNTTPGNQIPLIIVRGNERFQLTLTY